MIKTIASRVLTLGMLALALGLVCGCQKNREEEAGAVSQRPDELASAANMIRGGQPAEAQKTLDAWLEKEPKHAYGAEAHYLLGQALAAQGEHEAAKKELERAIDQSCDRTLKVLAMFGRADCNLALGNNSLASRQYHWLETMCRDVKALPQDELMYKLGLACKRAECQDTADYWFKQVIDLYATGPYYEKARQEHSKFTPTDPDVAPQVYTLEVCQFGKREKADAEASVLREKGYRDVQVIETTQMSIPVYEVHIGKFGNKSDAMRAQTDAELAGLPTTLCPKILEPLK